MANKVVIPVELQTQLTGMKEAVGQLQQELSGNKFKINLDSSAAKRFKGLTQDFEKEFKDFQSKIAGGEIDLVDEKDFQKQAKALITTYQKILNEFGNGSLSVDLAKQLFPSRFPQELDKIKNQVKNSLKDLKANEETTASLNELQDKLNKITTEKQNLENVKTKTDFQNQIDNETAAIKEATTALKEYYDAKEQRAAIESAAKKEINQTSEGRSEQQLRRSLATKSSQLSAILNSPSLSNDDRTLLQTDAGKTVKRWQKGLMDSQDKLVKARASGEDYKIKSAEFLVGAYSKKLDIGTRYLEKENEVGVARQAWEEASQKIEQMVANRVAEVVEALNSGDESKVPASLKGIYDEGKANRDKRDTAKVNLEAAKKGKTTAITDNAKNKEFNELQEKANKITESINKLNNSFKDIDATPIKEALEKARLEDLAKNFTLSEESLSKLQEQLKTLDAEKAAELSQELERIVKECEGGGNSVNEFADIVAQIGQSADQTRQMAQEVANLSNQITQFFSISNGIQLFKNAIRDAYETVKELDAAMTETAVVTDFTISDMWDQLPDYTAQANELGMATVEMYNAATIWYQQGGLLKPSGANFY